MEKLKVKELLAGETFVQEAINVIVPSATLDVSNQQMARIEKKVIELAMDKLQKKMQETLVSGKSVEFPRLFRVNPYTSSVRKNANGTFKVKASIVTRKGLEDALNN